MEKPVPHSLPQARQGSPGRFHRSANGPPTGKRYTCVQKKHSVFLQSCQEQTCYFYPFYPEIDAKALSKEKPPLRARDGFGGRHTV